MARVMHGRFSHLNNGLNVVFRQPSNDVQSHWTEKIEKWNIVSWILRGGEFETVALLLVLISDPRRVAHPDYSVSVYTLCRNYILWDICFWGFTAVGRSKGWRGTTVESVEWGCTCNQVFCKLFLIVSWFCC